MSGSPTVRTKETIPIHLSNSTDGELLTFCSGLTPIGNLVVAVFEQYNINSKDLQKKILEKWLDLSSSQIRDYLDSHRISTYHASSIWREFIYCIIGQHGSVRSSEDDGICYEERIFLREACHVLGLNYEDLGIISKGRYSNEDKRLAALHVPKGWKFNTDRHVVPVKVCAVCNDLIERNALVSSGVVICHQCYQHLPPDDKSYYGFGVFSECRYIMIKRAEEAANYRSVSDRLEEAYAEVLKNRLFLPRE